MLISRCLQFNDTLYDYIKLLKWDTVSGFGYLPTRCSHPTVKGRHCWFYLPLLFADDSQFVGVLEVTWWTSPISWCPGHDPASDVTSLRSHSQFLLQQLLLPCSPLCWHKPQQNWPKSDTLCICECVCLNRYRYCFHFTCSSQWPGG